MSISDELDTYFFRRKMEKTRSRKGEMDGRVFISHQTRQFSFVENMIERLFPICILNWHVNIYVIRQRKSVNTRNESTFN